MCNILKTNKIRWVSRDFYCCSVCPWQLHSHWLRTVPSQIYYCRYCFSTALFLFMYLSIADLNQQLTLSVTLFLKHLPWLSGSGSFVSIQWRNVGCHWALHYFPGSRASVLVFFKISRDLRPRTSSKTSRDIGDRRITPDPFRVILR